MNSAGPIDVAPRRKYSLLPLLVFLFLVSYGLLTLLVVEQDRTISAQRTTIQLLLGDSQELAAAKRKAATGQSQAGSEPQNQSPAGNQSPGGKEQQKHKNSPRSRREMRPTPKFVPEKPPVPASDAADERRAPISI